MIKIIAQQSTVYLGIIILKLVSMVWIETLEKPAPVAHGYIKLHLLCHLVNKSLSL